MWGHPGEKTQASELSQPWVKVTRRSPIPPKAKGKKTSGGSQLEKKP